MEPSADDAEWRDGHFLTRGKVIDQRSEAQQAAYFTVANETEHQYYRADGLPTPEPQGTLAYIET